MKNMLEYFEVTASKFSEKTAFIDSSRKASFGETYKNARRIATRLTQFGTKRPIAIFVDKSCNCIDCMLAALYAGDYYTVIDVKSPKDRIESILKTLKNAVIIADDHSIELAQKFESKYEIVRYEEAVTSDVDGELLDTIRAEMIDLDIAYILFTSGSTGAPKGTVVNHRSLISYVDWVTEEFGFDENTVFGSQTPLYFSMSVTDFYSTIK